MTKAEEKELEKLAQEFEQSAFEDDKLQGRAIRAFSHVIKWWSEEMHRARASEDPLGHFLDASSMMAFQIAAVLRSTLVGQPEEFKRRLMTSIISALENGTNECILPTRNEINEFDAFINASVH